MIEPGADLSKAVWNDETIFPEGIELGQCLLYTKALLALYLCFKLPHITASLPKTSTENPL